jgi:hypothetical protein
VQLSSTKPEAADSCAGDGKFTRSSGRTRAGTPYVGGENGVFEVMANSPNREKPTAGLDSSPPFVVYWPK